MRRQLIAALSAVPLVACAAGPPPAKTVDRRAWTPPEQMAETVGGDLVTVIGTPFYAVFKGVACVASVVLAAPASAGLALTTRPDRELIRTDLNKGVGQNCGGSYVLGRS